MQMNGINGLITIAKYWKEWADPRLIVLVLNNRDLNQVTWEQRVMSGFPKFEDSQTLPDFPYAMYAESLGLTGIRLDKPSEIGRAWEEALRASRPVVIDAVTDPEVPTLPPHISLEQAMGYLKSILKGDPNSKQMAARSYQQMLDGWMPGRRLGKHLAQEKNLDIQRDSAEEHPSHKHHQHV
jgi:pyruvate dehydrogenase (quinone)